MHCYATLSCMLPAQIAAKANNFDLPFLTFRSQSTFYLIYILSVHMFT